ncbi:hypothetical protein LCGC14_1387900 [marine sediment metagenome]|uniref:Uncharacterized protein n=1 Tax=marine sediment metagenome TaxID=412755 RepID=A0A0F9K0T4_9ZZZZ
MTFIDIAVGIIIGSIFGFGIGFLFITFKKYFFVKKSIKKINEQEYKFKEFKSLNEAN